MAKSLRNSQNIIYEICQAIRDEESLSRAAIASDLHQSPATIGRIVDQLILEKILFETGEKKRDIVGRPSKILRFNLNLFSVLTVDLRAIEVYAAITDLGGSILKSTFQSITPGDAPQTIRQLTKIVHNMLEIAAGLPPVAVIVIGAPSVVNADTGTIEFAASLKWENVPLKKILEDEFHIDVIVENDVNLAALGEYWKGAGRSIEKNMLFVSIGTGIGAGLILNGELYSGSTHAAGEVAYFVTDVNVLRENAGQIGTLERRVGRDGLVRQAQLVAQRYPASRLSDLIHRDGLSVKTQDILSLAEEGDVAAGVVYKDIVEILTIVICNSAVLLDPEMIILGGPSDWKWFSLIKAIQECIGSTLFRPVNLVPSELGNNALILGGSYIALSRVLATRN
jgi:glucokinase